METVAQQGSVHGVDGGGTYLTGTDKPVRRHGGGGRVTGDGVEREVDLPNARRADSLATGLGWFSIGLGVAQIVAPRGMSRLIGVKDTDGNTAVMRAVGMREIAAGIGLLSDPKPTGFAVARVAGDVMDLAMLANALNTPENNRGRTALATAAVLGVGLLDVLASEKLASTVPKVVHPAMPASTIELRRSVTIARPIDDVYAFWRNVESLPQFMKHIDSVRKVSDQRSNELISWRTIGVSDLTGHGTVAFRPAPGGRGTEVHADVSYQAPGGALGAKIARFFRDVPGVRIENQLNVLKQIMETGEEVRSDSSIHKGSHPAQPPSGRVNFDTRAPA